MAVSFENVSYKYERGNYGLKDINLNIKTGKKTGILGLNGSGKSTLLNHINGIFTPTTGEVKVLDMKVEKENLWEIRRKVGFLFDYPDHQLFSTSVYKDIKFGLDNYDYSEEEKERKIEKVLIDLGIEDLKDKPPQDLSLGQKKKVCVAGIIVLDPEIILCDEPFSGLDGYFTAYFKKLLDNWADQGKTIIFSSHDVNLCYEWSDEVVVLSNGRVVEKGKTEDLMTNSTLYKKTNLEKPILFSLFEDRKEKPRSVEEGKALLNL